LDLSNRAQISEQNGSYRRGLVLGLTMAEIVILIIFILLLALTALLEIERDKLLEEHEKLLEAEQQALSAERKATDLTEQMSVLTDISGGEDIEELVRELVAARQVLKKTGELRSQLAEARELVTQYEDAAREAGVSPTPEGISSALDEAKELVAQYEDAAREAGVPPTPEGVSRALVESREIQEALAEFGDMTGKEIVQEGMELRTENTRLEGQLANAQKKLVSLGKGSEMPSCWAKTDGTVEYIYEVAVNSNGMIVRKTNLPHREADRGLLPNSKLIENQDVSSSEFRSMTRPIYQWSIEKKCRFYVKVYDLTGIAEKDIYKQRLKTVEGYFYKDFRIYKDF
jgi:hypothetical protein